MIIPSHQTHIGTLALPEPTGAPDGAGKALAVPGRSLVPHSEHALAALPPALSNLPPEDHMATPPKAQQGDHALRLQMDQLLQANHQLSAQNRQLLGDNTDLQAMLAAQDTQMQAQSQELRDLAAKVDQLTGLLTAQPAPTQAQAKGADPVKTAARQVERMRWELTFLQFDINRANRNGGDVSAFKETKTLVRQTMLQAASTMAFEARDRTNAPGFNSRIGQSDLRELRFQREMLSHELGNIKGEAPDPSNQGLETLFQQQLQDFDDTIAMLVQKNVFALRDESEPPTPTPTFAPVSTQPWTGQPLGQVPLGTHSTVHDPLLYRSMSGTAGDTRVQRAQDLPDDGGLDIGKQLDLTDPEDEPIGTVYSDGNPFARRAADDDARQEEIVFIDAPSAQQSAKPPSGVPDAAAGPEDEPIKTVYSDGNPFVRRAAGDDAQQSAKPPSGVPDAAAGVAGGEPSSVLDIWHPDPAGPEDEPIKTVYSDGNPFARHAAGDDAQQSAKPPSGAPDAAAGVTGGKPPGGLGSLWDVE